MKTVPLGSQHVEDAARLVASRFCALRRCVPAMPSSWEDVPALSDRLGQVIGRVDGVAAIEAGRLVGFLVGLDLPEFRGAHAIYSPEWAHGAIAGSSRRIHEALYAAASGVWAAGGAGAHLILALAHDEAALQAWRWLGFGMLAVDGLRDLSPVTARPVSVEIRRATLDDLPVVMSLSGALRQHLEAAPTFLVPGDPTTRQEHGAWLQDRRNALWLAHWDHQAVAYLRQGPANEDASETIMDPGTTSVSGAFTLPEFRERGIGAALLDQALAWGREQDYVRCAVDFEPMNTLAARFWVRHFHPISYGFIRHLDARAVGRGVGESPGAIVE